VFGSLEGEESIGERGREGEYTNAYSFLLFGFLKIK
jgi:hypothetical protein